MTTVLFKDENNLYSSGAADGTIKMWDIRRYYTTAKGALFGILFVWSREQGVGKRGYNVVRWERGTGFRGSRKGELASGPRRGRGGTGFRGGRGGTGFRGSREGELAPGKGEGALASGEGELASGGRELAPE